MRRYILAAWFGAVLVAGCGGGGGSSSPPPNPVPSISSLSPSSVTAGAAAFTLTVNGSNFIPTSTIQWNNSSRTTSYVSATQLTAPIGAADIATAGTLPITVVNPAPGGGTSAGISLAVNNPLPSISSLAPASVAVGGAAFTLTVKGGGFVAGSTVQWNGSSRTTTYASATQLTASITVADVASPNSANVTVVNPTPGGGTSAGAAVVVGHPVPFVSTLSPYSVTAGGAAMVLTVTGGNFVSTSTVQWNGSTRVTSYVSPTQLTASITAADIATVGTATITVTSSSPGSGSSGAVGLQIHSGGRYRASAVGVWGSFDDRGNGCCYYSGQIIQTWNQFDPFVGTNVSQEISLQLDKMRSMGVNNITFDLRTSDNVSDQTPYTFPTCQLTPAVGFQYPQPTATELANFPLFLNLVQSRGMKVDLILNNVHMDDVSPANWQTWLSAILNIAGTHPAVDVILFGGSPHVVDTNGDGVADACGVPAEAPLWWGAGSIVAQYVKWAIGYGMALGIPARKLSAEAIVGVYSFNAAISGGSLSDPVAVMKGIFDSLGIPDSQRTYALSFYEAEKCRYTPFTCTDERADYWAAEVAASVVNTIASTAPRVLLVEFGASIPVDILTWTSQHAFENIAALIEKYGFVGGNYWTWVETDDATDADPAQGLPIKRRGTAFKYTAAQLELEDWGGYHLYAIPNPSFENAASNGGAAVTWDVSGDGSAAAYDLTQEPGQPEVATRGTFALRLVNGGALTSAETASSHRVGVLPNQTYTTTANLRFSWSGDPNPSASPAQRPQVFMTTLYFKADGTLSAVRASDTSSWFQENSTAGFGTFPVRYTTPSDAAQVAVQFGVIRNGLPTAITLDVDNVR